LSENFGKGFEFGPDFYLTNDKELIKKLISPNLKDAMGSLEYHSILEQGVAFYAKDNEPLQSDEDMRLFVDTALRFIKYFSFALWGVRDNAVNCEFGFLEQSSSNSQQTFSNFVASLAVKADGTFESTAFSLTDLRIARDYYKSILRSLYPKAVESSIFNKNMGRPTRFLLFAEAARTETDLAIRVSTSMTCLEILFSTDAAELTHKLSQRVACYLGNTKAERISLFQAMKRAYSVRSKVVHGDTLQAKLETEMVNVSKEVDEIVRRLFVRIVSDDKERALFEKSKEDLESYFIQLTFDNRTDDHVEPLNPTGS